MEACVKIMVYPVHDVPLRRPRGVLTLHGAARRPGVAACRPSAPRRAQRRGAGAAMALGGSLAGHALALVALLTWGFTAPRSTPPEAETLWEVNLPPPPPAREPEALVEMPAAHLTGLPPATPDWPALSLPPEAPPLPEVWMEARLTPPPQAARDTDFRAEPPTASAPAADVNDPFWTEVRTRIARELKQRCGHLRHQEASAVVLRLTLDAQGHLTEATAESWYGSLEFRQAALEAVHAAAPFPPSESWMEPSTRTARVPLRFDPEG